MELCLDVIVMDIVMFEMNGIDVILVIFKEWFEVKILIVSFYLDNEKIMFVLNVGVRGYMFKIFSVDELFYVVCKVVVGELVIE